MAKDQELDDNDDDEMIHVDYLKDALTEEYIQSMEKQLASSVAPTNNPVQDRLEQDNFDCLINDDEERVQADGQLQEWQEDEDELFNDDDDGNGRHCKVCDMEFEDNRQYRRHVKKHSEVSMEW